MTDISTLLTRMRSLAVQAADGTLGDGERHDLDTRFRDLNDQIDQVIEVAEINGETPSGLRPFDGQSVSVGIHSSVVFGTAELERVEVNGTVANLGGSGAGAIEVGTLAGALNSLPVLDSAIAAAGSFVSAFEVFEDRVGLAIQAGRAAIADRVQAEDAIQDVDEAAERAELTRDAALSEPQAARRAHYDISPEAAMALLR